VFTIVGAYDEHEPISGFGAEPPEKSRGRGPGHGVKGEAPEAESILVLQKCK